MLDELCALAGDNRSYAARLLRARARGTPAPMRCRGRAPAYDRQLLVPLCRVWATLGGICGNCLPAAMACTLAVLERHGEPARQGGRAHTKPGSLLRRHIPVRTVADWDEGRPGFPEVDLVGHEGGEPPGEFAYSLRATDLTSGGTEPRILHNRARRCTYEALLGVPHSLPIPLLGIDSVGGSEFINAHLASYCSAERITPASSSRRTGR